MVALSVTLDVNAAPVGVPEIKPDTESNVKPVGNPTAPKLVGELVAVIWYEKAVPIVPLAMSLLVITGIGPAVIVKFTPLPDTPPTITTTFPVVAPLGTATVMLVALQLVGVPAVPLNVTVLVLCVAPKFVPVIVTGVPTGPDD